MKFSIITPCRDAAGLLGETIESIVNQTAVRDGAVSLEYRIVDGVSSDGTAALVERYADRGVEFRSEPDSGMYDALAKGLQSATGDVVAYLNAGDTYHLRAFEVLAEVFAQPGVDWVTGYSVLQNDRSQVIASWKPPRFRREFFETGVYLGPHPRPGVQQESTFWSAKLNRSIDLEKLRRFRLAGDYFLWHTFASHAPLHSVYSHLGAFRIHHGQLSSSIDAYNEEARSLVRPMTFQEKLTEYWEYRCNPALRGFLWNYILPPSPARIFEYDCAEARWAAR